MRVGTTDFIEIWKPKFDNINNKSMHGDIFVIDILNL
jgi:hypothetical protein